MRITPSPLLGPAIQSLSSLTLPLVLVTACSGTRSSAPPVLGGELPCELEDGTRHGVSSAQTARGCEVLADGVRFFVASVDGRKVAYVKTSDSHFITPEGLKVGSSLEDVRGAGGSAVVAEAGWAFFSELPSGWRAMFAGLPDHGAPRPNGLLSNVAGSTVVAFTQGRP